MRTIKFRFWNPPTKSFVEQYKYSGYVDELFEQDSMLIPSQYTGLSDDFGNEIWEGDIIEFKRKDRDGMHEAEIQFVEGGYLAKFIKHEGTLSFFWLAHLNDYCNIKVIGNKFAKLTWFDIIESPLIEEDNAPVGCALEKKEKQ